MNQKELLFISVTFFMTVLIWIVADLFHAGNAQQIVQKNPRFARAIKLHISKEVFDKLEQRR